MKGRDDRLGLRSGVGLVVSNMVGAGVFLSAGFMAQDLTPGLILISWVIGALVALAGARSYAAVATWIPRSGGEYRYLSELIHPALGSVAGWASLLVGFSAPIAVSALAAGDYARILGVPLPARVSAALVVVALGVLHATNRRTSKGGHNILFVIKAVLLLAFVAAGLFLGSNTWPTWRPEGWTDTSPFPTEAFARGLFFIAFAFSGWNAAIYNASDFRDPRRDVPRALLFGCGAVALLYLAVNWVLVANLHPADFKVVFGYEESRVTLGHIILTRLLGETGGRVMSALVLMAFISAASAMIVVGPRVYATMAEDGFLPGVLRTEGGEVPARSIALQCAVAIAILATHTIQETLASLGAILTLFAALVSLAVLRRGWSIRGTSEGLDPITIAAATIHVATSVFMLWFGLRNAPSFAIWLVAITACAAIYWATRSRRLSP